MAASLDVQLIIWSRVMTPDELNDIEKTYQATMYGNYRPDYIVIYCSECEEEFFLSVKNTEDNIICEHIKNLGAGL
jgi:hypothetical protein